MSNSVGLRVWMLVVALLVLVVWVFPTYLVALSQTSGSTEDLATSTYEVYPDKLITPHSTISFNEIKAAAPSTLAYALAIIAEENAVVRVYSGDYDLGKLEVSEYVKNLKIEGIGKVVVKGRLFARGLESLVVDNIEFRSAKHPSIVVENAGSVELSRILFKSRVLVEARNITSLMVKNSIGSGGVVVQGRSVSKLVFLNNVVTVNDTVINIVDSNYILMKSCRVFTENTLIEASGIRSIILLSDFIHSKRTVLEVNGNTTLIIQGDQIEAEESLAELGKGTILLRIEDSRVKYRECLFKAENKTNLGAIFANTLFQPSSPLDVLRLGGEKVVIERPATKSFAYVLLTNNSRLDLELGGSTLIVGYRDGSAILGFLIYRSQNNAITLNTTYYFNKEGILGSILLATVKPYRLVVKAGGEAFEGLPLAGGLVGILIPESKLQETRLFSVEIGAPPTTTPRKETTTTTTTATTPTASTFTSVTSSSPARETSLPAESTTGTPAPASSEKTVNIIPASPQIVVAEKPAKLSPIAVASSLLVIVFGAGWLAYSQFKRRRQLAGEVEEVMPE